MATARLGEIRSAYLCTLACSIVAGVLVIAGVLHFWGAAEIRADFTEVIGLSALGLVWLILLLMLFSWFGVSLRDDVFERNNGAAALALSGAVLGSAFIYSGSSAGEGPSYSNNFFCAILGEAGLMALWALVERLGQISRSIAEDRDIASGLRFAGLMMGIGLVFGRALAGNWHSVADTFRDFLQQGSFAVVIAGIAVALELFLRPNRARPFPRALTCGLLAGLFYIALAILWVFHLGPWEGLPR